MNADELRSLQAPIKDGYREHPETALVTLRAQGRIGEGLTCKVETGKALVEAGLHPATGGDGLSACSGDMLLEALVACAGVTLRAVATAIEIPVRGDPRRRRHRFPRHARGLETGSCGVCCDPAPLRARYRRDSRAACDAAQ